MTAETEMTMREILDRYEAAEGLDEKLTLARRAVEQLAAYNPWEVRLRALHYARRERLKLEMSAFLWSIPLAALMLVGTIALVEWLA